MPPSVDNIYPLKVEPQKLVKTEQVGPSVKVKGEQVKAEQVEPSVKVRSEQVAPSVQMKVETEVMTKTKPVFTVDIPTMHCLMHCTSSQDAAQSVQLLPGPGLDLSLASPNPTVHSDHMARHGRR